MRSFDEVVGWEATEDGWRGHVDEDWLQGRTLFGGLAAGIGVRALLTHSEGRPLRTVSSWFVAPTAPGPAQLTARVLRRGGSVTHAQASIERQGQLCTQVSAVFGAARDSSLRQDLPRVQPRVSVEDAVVLPYIEGVVPRFVRAMDMRWAGEHAPFSGAPEGIIEGWCRHRTPASAGPEAVLALIDAWPPPTLPMLGKPSAASSVTWTAHLVGDVYADPAGWWYYRGWVERVADGYATTRAALWGPDGSQVAWSEQLAVVFG